MPINFPLFKCEALLVLGISARRPYERARSLASTLLQIFKDFTLIKDRGFLINDWGFRTQRTHDVSVYTNFQECTAGFYTVNVNMRSKFKRYNSRTGSEMVGFFTVEMEMVGFFKFEIKIVGFFTFKMGIVGFFKFEME